MEINTYLHRIKIERINKNISQKKLAEMADIDNTTLSRLENGKIDITVKNLIKIADALNINIEYLLLDYVPDNYYNPTDYLWKQISKLDDEQQKRLINIILILTQSNEQWHDMNPRSVSSSKNNKIVNYLEIGTRIRSLRVQKKLSQEKLAELAGISTSFLGSIERGEEILSLETLYRVANALQQPASRLLLNANTGDPVLNLFDVVDELSHIDDSKAAMLLNILLLLLDNSDKW